LFRLLRQTATGNSENFKALTAAAQFSTTIPLRRHGDCTATDGCCCRCRWWL